MRISSAEAMQAFAAQFVERLSPQEKEAVVVTLSGELGAGKTTFTQGLARAFGIEETVSSPTFVIEKIYSIEKDIRCPFSRLVHIDAYRLQGAHELEVIGWSELIADPGNLIVLEWPEKVADAVPEGAITIRFDIEGDERIISIDGEKSTDKE